MCNHTEPSRNRPVEAGSGAGASGRRVLLAAAALLPALLPGCGLLADRGAGTLVGPDYETPPTPTADQWIDYRDARLSSQEADLRTWWKVLGDPVLDDLMAQAAAQNLSLQAAVERVAAARARRDLAAGFMYPQEQGASGAVSGVHSSEETANFPTTPFDRTSQDWRTDAFATWEIDFWGRYRRAVESADAVLQASLADHDDVLVLLYAELASRYVSYRTFQDRLRYLRANEAIQLAAYELTRARFEAGEVAERDIHEARQILEETRALIPQAELGLRLENNALCSLRGLPPRDLSAELGEAPIPRVPPTAAVGIPADLLRRRPDVRRAERLAAARCAEIGIAESDFYPRLGIAGSLGVQAAHGDDLDDSGARTSLLSAGFSWSILDWGRTASNVRAFEAEFRAAALDYQQAVLDAGRQAEDALVTLLKSQERLAPQRAAAEAALRTVQIVQDQYAEGEVDFSDVFVFTSNLTQQQDRLATAARAAAQALVGVYRALGGGWQPPAPQDAGAGGAPPQAQHGDSP
jgi:NodT family efflux transporter outer membrane factor (OMF) lipoprotein